MVMSTSTARSFIAAEDSKMSLDFIQEVLALPIWTQQREIELIRLFKFLENYEIKTYIEIGTFQGGTMALFSRFLGSDAMLISVDIGHTIPEKTQEKIVTKQNNAHFIKGDSTDIDTVLRVKSLLAGQKADLLFIDGNHNSAMADYSLWSNLVKDSGLIIFHDINENGPAGNVGSVPNDWKQIREGHVFYEFVEGHIDGYGIGIMVK